MPNYISYSQDEKNNLVKKQNAILDKFRTKVQETESPTENKPIISNKLIEIPGNTNVTNISNQNNNNGIHSIQELVGNIPNDQLILNPGQKKLLDNTKKLLDPNTIDKIARKALKDKLIVDSGLNDNSEQGHEVLNDQIDRIFKASADGEQWATDKINESISNYAPKNAPTWKPQKTNLSTNMLNESPTINAIDTNNLTPFSEPNTRNLNKDLYQSTLTIPNPYYHTTSSERANHVLQNKNTLDKAAYFGETAGRALLDFIPGSGYIQESDNHKELDQAFNDSDNIVGVAAKLTKNLASGLVGTAPLLLAPEMGGEGALAKFISQFGLGAGIAGSRQINKAIKGETPSTAETLTDMTTEGIMFPLYGVLGGIKAFNDPNITKGLLNFGLQVGGQSLASEIKNVINSTVSLNQSKGIEFNKALKTAINNTKDPENIGVTLLNFGLLHGIGKYQSIPTELQNENLKSSNNFGDTMLKKYLSSNYKNWDEFFNAQEPHIQEKLNQSIENKKNLTFKDKIVSILTDKLPKEGIVTSTKDNLTRVPNGYTSDRGTLLSNGKALSDNKEPDITVDKTNENDVNIREKNNENSSVENGQKQTSNTSSINEYVLQMADAGLSSQEIAGSLNVTKEQVDNIIQTKPEQRLVDIPNNTTKKVSDKTKAFVEKKVDGILTNGGGIEDVKAEYASNDATSRHAIQYAKSKINTVPQFDKQDNITQQPVNVIQPQVNVGGKEFTFTVPNNNGSVSESAMGNDIEDLYKADRNGNVAFAETEYKERNTKHAVNNRDYFIKPLYNTYNKDDRDEPVFGYKIHRAPQLNENGTLKKKGVIEYNYGDGFESEKTKQTIKQLKEIPPEQANATNEEVKEQKVKIPNNEPNFIRPEAEQTTDNKGYGDDNKFVSKDRYEELKKKMQAKLSQLNAGIDPEMLSMGMEIAAYHLEAGARKFSAFSKLMIEEFGEKIKPYLKAFYNGAKDMPEMAEFEHEFDSHEIVKKHNFDDENKTVALIPNSNDSQNKSIDNKGIDDKKETDPEINMKQPYEMTKGEYEKAVFDGRINFNLIGNQKKTIQDLVKAYNEVNQSSDTSNSEVVKKDILYHLKGVHKHEVINALFREDKEIPDKVLIDYPDLQEKQILRKNTKKVNLSNNEKNVSKNLVKIPNNEQLQSSKENADGNKSEVMTKEFNIGDKVTYKGGEYKIGYKHTGGLYDLVDPSNEYSQPSYQKVHNTNLEKIDSQKKSVNEPKDNDGMRSVIDHLVKTPLHLLGEAIKDKVQTEAESMLKQLEISERKHKKSFVEKTTDFNGENVNVIGGYDVNTYPVWFSGLNRDRNDVIKAIDKILKDNGVDKGKLVENLKQIIVDHLTNGQEIGQREYGIFKKQGEVPPDEEMKSFFSKHKNSILSPEEIKNSAETHFIQDDLDWDIDYLNEKLTNSDLQDNTNTDEDSFNEPTSEELFNNIEKEKPTLSNKVVTNEDIEAEKAQLNTKLKKLYKEKSSLTAQLDIPGTNIAETKKLISNINSEIEKIQNQLDKRGLFSEENLDSAQINIFEQGEENNLTNINNNTNLNTKNENNNVSDKSGNSQRYSNDSEIPVSSDAETLQRNGKESESNGRQIKNESGLRYWEQERRESNVDSPTTSIGTSGNFAIQGNTPTVFGNLTGDFDGAGSSIFSSSGDNGSDTKRGEDSSKPIGKISTEIKKELTSKNDLQKAAESNKSILMDIDNIRSDLPFLLPEQHEDVLKAETRFFSNKHNSKNLAFGKGILFTNGTGTGKTYTGLGIIKRFVKNGKDRILIVTPSQQKVNDWCSDSKNLLLDVSPLPNTSTSGKGIVATTYANFRENEEILKTDWDLVVYDESHRLMEEKNGNQSSTTNTHFLVTNKDEFTALSKLQKIHPLWKEYKEIYEEYKKLNPQSKEDLSGFPEEKQKMIKALSDKLDKIELKKNKILPELEKKAKTLVNKTKVVFLSATPFKGHFNLRYANGYLFDWSGDTTYIGNSRVDPESRFFLDNFGAAYEWKYHRLQVNSKSNAEAIAAQEIMFSDKLSKQGVMSGRAISSPQDYERVFPIPSGFNNELFNKAYADVFNYTDNDFDGIRQHLSNLFYNYQYSTQLFEVLKASMHIERIKEHLNLGRKVVIFHRRQQANVSPPFALALRRATAAAKELVQGENVSPENELTSKQILSQVSAFQKKYRDLLEYEKTLNYDPVVTQFKNEFGDRIGFFNGEVPNKLRAQNIKKFNQDHSGLDILLVQEEAGKEGISLHDVTGIHQRVLMNLALPISSITALQVEGRIYRIGNQSNAIFEYPLLGLDTEIGHFGRNLNRKLSTTENLAMGEQARDLLRSFAEGVLFNQTKDLPNLEQGKGGKEYDRRLQQQLNEYMKAKGFYYSNIKRNSSSKSSEGIDYFPTPEPLGLKMVEWSDIKESEKLLEPSAGHGAIAMWVPKHANLTAIEPSFELSSKLEARSGGGNKKILNQPFEDYNIINKYDAVVMNPPFGTAGKTAFDHFEKGFHHLNNTGRIVAILPESPNLLRKMENFLYGQNENGKPYNPNAILIAKIKLPSVTFMRAGTKVNSSVWIIDKLDNIDDRYRNFGTENIDLSEYKTIDELFDSIENLEIPCRISKSNDYTEDNNGKSNTLTDNDKMIVNGEPLTVKLSKHTQTGENIWVANIDKKVDRDVYKGIEKEILKIGGYYSRYVKGFVFKENPIKEQRSDSGNRASKKFIEDIDQKIKDKFPDVDISYENNDSYVNGLVDLGYRSNSKTTPVAYVDRNNKVHINVDKAQTDSQIHEVVGHIFMDHLEKADPIMYKKALQIIRKDAKLLENVREIYPELGDDALEREALANAIGKGGSDYLSDKTLSETLKLWIEMIWERFKNWATDKGLIKKNTNARAWAYKFVKDIFDNKGRIYSTEKNEITKTYDKLKQMGEDFSQKIDNFIEGKLKSNELLTVTETPDILVKLGAKQLPVTISQEALKKDMFTKHHIPIDLIKQIPIALHEPIFVFDSATEKNSLVVVTELEHNNHSVMVAIHLDARQNRHIVNKIASAYTKENDFIYVKMIKNGLLRYVDNKKSSSWFQLRGLYLPKRDSKKNFTSFGNILNENDVVKPFSEYEELNKPDLKFQKVDELTDDKKQANYDRIVSKLDSNNKSSLSFVGDGIKALGNWGVKFGKSFQEMFVPASVSDNSMRTAMSMRQYAASIARHREFLHKYTLEAKKNFDRLSNAERLNILDTIENPDKGIESLEPNLRHIATFMRTNLDIAWKRIQDIKGTESFIENYFPHYWKDKTTAETIFSKRNLEGQKSFLKQRKLATIRDGIEAGLIPLTTNPVDLFLLKMQDMNKYIAANDLKNQLKDKGLIKYYRKYSDVPVGWTAIDDNMFDVMGGLVHEDGEGNKTFHRKRVDIENNPVKFELGDEEIELPNNENVTAIGVIKNGRYYAPEEAARIINNYCSPGLAGNAIYDGFRGVSNLMNQIQLSTSAFHLVFTTADAITSSMALGVEKASLGDYKGAAKDITQSLSLVLPTINNLIKGNRLYNAYFNKIDGYEEQVNSLIKAGGRVSQDSFYQTNQWNKAAEAWRQGHNIESITRLPLAVIDLMSKPIMEYIVPRQKLGLFYKQCDFILSQSKKRGWSDEEIQKRMAEAWDSIDNRMGQLVYDNLFWKKTYKDMGMISVRSLGWNLGTIRELAGGISDARKVITEKRVTPKLAYTLSLPVMTMFIGAIIQSLLTGKAPNDIKDYFFPKTGDKLSDGTDERIAVPGYMKDVVAYGIQPTTTIAHKLHPFISMLNDLSRNKDYQGFEIANPNDPSLDKLYDRAFYIGNQFMPFSVRNFRNMRDNEEGVGKSLALSAFGFNAAPRYISNTALQNKIFELYGQRFEGTKTSEQKDQKEILKEARQIYFKDKEKSRQYLEEQIQEGHLNKDNKWVNAFFKNADMPLDLRLFKRLPETDQETLLGSMNDKEFIKFSPEANKKVWEDNNLKDRAEKLKNTIYNEDNKSKLEAHLEGNKYNTNSSINIKIRVPEIKIGK